MQFQYLSSGSALGTWPEGSGQFTTLASIITTFNQKEETNHFSAMQPSEALGILTSTLLLRLALPLLPYLPDLPPTDATSRS